MPPQGLVPSPAFWVVRFIVCYGLQGTEQEGLVCTRCGLNSTPSLEHEHVARSSEAWQQQTRLSGRRQGPGCGMPPLLVLMQLMCPHGVEEGKSPKHGGSVVYSAAVSFPRPTSLYHNHPGVKPYD